MQRTIVLLLLLFLGCHADEHFVFPDDSSRFEGRLHDLFNASEGPVFIVTPHLSHRPLRRILQKALEASRPITLVTARPADDDAAYLSQFRTLTPLQLKGLSDDHYDGSLQLTMLLFDNCVCSLTLPLRRDALRHDLGLGHCDSSDAELAHYRRVAQTLLERSTPYLK